MRRLLEHGADVTRAVAVQQHSTLQLRLRRPGGGAVAAAELARRHGQAEMAEIIDGFVPPAAA